MARPQPPEPTVARFRAWTDDRGVAAVARDLGVTISTVSHLRSGATMPSLTLAARIEARSCAFVRATDWVSR